MKRFTALLVGAALMMAAGSAFATPIYGTIDFIGSVKLTGPVSPIRAGNATGVQFISVLAQNTDGAYASIIDFTPVTFNDFVFGPSLAAPVTPLWTLINAGITYSFDLNSVHAYNVPSNVLSLNGLGVLSATGYDNTPGTWSFSTQDGINAKISFSATSAPVPEPGTMMLLGFGMLGLAVYGKRRMNKEA